jgi:hypothetical protein
VVGAYFSEARVLGKKAVTGMDRIAFGDQSRRNDVGDVQIRASRWTGADAKRFIGLTHVHGIAVCFGKDRNGRNAEFLTCSIDSQRDLAAISD